MMVGQRKEKEKVRKRTLSYCNHYTTLHAPTGIFLVNSSLQLKINAPVLHLGLCGDEQKLSSLKHSLILPRVGGGRAILETQKALQFQVPGKKAFLKIHREKNKETFVIIFQFE